MTGAERTVSQQRAHIFRQIEQARHVGDMAAAFADDLGDLFLGLAEILGQPGIGLGLFER